MSEEAGDEVEGEGEVASPDWRVRAGPRNRPTQNCREEDEATHVPFRDWCTTLYDGHRTHPPLRHQTNECGLIEKTHRFDGPLLHEHELCGEC